ncbi:hypothetical protein GBO17_08305 [Mycobacterium avium subsp. hominissuis]|nr:hypothetical protein [Mycobacterium avium subsp. hominissuis]MBZ4568481.1 hypothetical protein [Mycobacterium avium subsp. hominissuis]MBZ4586377.1 hypothetical protein [Mycobacterium avium subsp. hominissuis]MBZ4624110.1 hypothetical protein [Mycobacterium avium subsp. hominissuis]
MTGPPPDRRTAGRCGDRVGALPVHQMGDQPGDDHQRHQDGEHQRHVRPRHPGYPEVPPAWRARRIRAMPLPSRPSSNAAVT